MRRRVKARIPAEFGCNTAHFFQLFQGRNKRRAVKPRYFAAVLRRKSCRFVGIRVEVFADFRVINPAASPAYARAVAILEDWDKSGQPVLEP